jgi:hypothetical protein
VIEGRVEKAVPDVPPVTGRTAGRSAVVALSVFAVVDVVRTFLAVGHYEDRITVVTHGEPDVWVPAAGYALFELAVREAGWASGYHLQANDVYQAVWLLAAVVAVAAAAVWLRRARALPRADRVTAGWAGAAVLLTAVSGLHHAVAAPPSPSVDGALATRPVAYSLWVVSTIVLVVATVRVVRMIRRTVAG